MARIQFKRGTTQEWEQANPVLLPGTPGFDTTTGALKIGDGVTAWVDLPVVGSGVDAAVVEAAVNAATEPLVSRIDALEANLNAVMEAFNYVSGAATPDTVSSWIENIGESITRINTDFRVFERDFGINVAAIADMQIVDKAEKADLLALDNRVVAAETAHQALLDALVTQFDRPGTPENVARWFEWTMKEIKDLAQAVFETVPNTYITRENAYEKFNELFTAVAGLSAGGGSLTPEEVEAAIGDAVTAAVSALETSVQNNTSNVQQIFDVFAQQEGGSIRQLQTFYDNLTAFLMQAMGAFAAFGNGEPTAAVTKFLADLNAEVENLRDKDAELTAMDAEIVQYIAEQIAGVSPDLSAYAKKTDLDPYAKTSDADQILTAKSITVGGIKFSSTGEIMAPYEDEYGNRLRLIPADLPGGEDVPIVVVHTDLQEILAPKAGGFELVQASKEIQSSGADISLVRSVLSAGKPIPDDVDWTPLDGLIDATSTAQARLVNGVVQFRGVIKERVTATSGGTIVASVPTTIPIPLVVCEFAGWASETGVGTKIGAIRVSTTKGRISLTAPTGPFDSISLTGISYPVY